jgi:hypothetical protein
MVLKSVPVKSNSTAADAVNFILSEVPRRKGSEAITRVLAMFPYQPRLSWFKQVYDYLDRSITYRYDDPGREQVKTPNRFLLDDRDGDCDDFSMYWLALLAAVDVKAYPKIVDYQPDAVWDHIYVIVPLKGGKYLTLDNVYGKFGGLFGQEVTYQDSQVFRHR